MEQEETLADLQRNLHLLARIHRDVVVAPVLGQSLDYRSVPGRNVAPEIFLECEILHDDKERDGQEDDEGRVHLHHRLGVEADLLQKLGVHEEAVGEAVGVDADPAIERDHEDEDDAVEDVGRRVHRRYVVAGVERVGEHRAGRRDDGAGVQDGRHHRLLGWVQLDAQGFGNREPHPVGEPPRVLDLALDRAAVEVRDIGHQGITAELIDVTRVGHGRITAVAAIRVCWSRGGDGSTVVHRCHGALEELQRSMRQ